MTRYVVGPDVALRLARERTPVSQTNRLLAPTLLRSQVLSLLYQAERTGTVSKREAAMQLDFIRGLRIRLLGDRVLQGTAWKVANQLGWPDTLDAEYIALTVLQADAFITLDPKLAKTVKALVAVAPFSALR